MTYLIGATLIFMVIVILVAGPDDKGDGRR